MMNVNILLKCVLKHININTEQEHETCIKPTDINCQQAVIISGVTIGACGTMTPHSHYGPSPFDLIVHNKYDGGKIIAMLSSWPPR